MIARALWKRKNAKGISDSMLVTAIVIMGLILLLVFSSQKASLHFLLAVTILYTYGVVDQSVILGNIINPSVITLLLLMLSSLALERTFLLSWISSKLLRYSYRWTLVRLAIISALSSAVINNTAVVATLMSSVLKNQDHSPSKLLIPLSYFSILGGTLTLIGTSTNLVVNGLIQEQGLPELHFFSFVPVGAVLFIFCSVVIFLLAYYLPDSKGKEAIVEKYFLDAEVKAGSKLVGKTVRQNRLRALDSLFLAEIVRDGRLLSPVTPEMVIEANDKLIFTGNVSEVKQLNTLDGIEIFADSNELLNRNLTEVIVSPESILINKTLKQTDFRSRFDAAVVAINRHGQSLSGKLGEQVIEAGDKLVLAIGEDFSKRQNITRNFFILTGLKLREPLTFAQNIVAIVGFFSAVFIAACTSFDLIETLSAYLIMCLGVKVFDATTLRRRFPFELWGILVSALTIAYAFTHSGLADAISSQLFSILGGSSVFIAFAGVFLVTVLLTETMTNSAAAAIMLPIGLSFAKTYGVHYLPFVMAVAYAASASFISPFGYQTNLMVMNAGNYKFSDYVKTGWPVTVMYCFVGLLSIPVFFPF
ncbi:Sulfate permease, Trk-type [Photobacterium marinum]|uniref:Sulfate permease, Trk-type n=2 Tax=Photobacterium marinum TaxID=1056511 RepID=L8J8B7_9GAMM|nr:Sulfate permease, Trk-type [Photobacterium marinum]